MWGSVSTLAEFWKTYKTDRRWVNAKKQLSERITAVGTREANIVAKQYRSAQQNITRRKANIVIKKTLSSTRSFLLVGEGGFEPPKSLTTDLQSAPFGHSGILPYSILKIEWSWWTDSNPRPADYKSAALPAELHQLIFFSLAFGLSPQRSFIITDRF